MNSEIAFNLLCKCCGYIIQRISFRFSKGCLTKRQRTPDEKERNWNCALLLSSFDQLLGMRNG